MANLYQFFCVIQVLQKNGYVIEFDTINPEDKISEPDIIVAVEYWITYKLGGGKNKKTTPVKNGCISEHLIIRSIIIGTDIDLTSLSDCKHQ